MSRRVERSSSYKRGYKRIRHNAKVLAALKEVVALLAADAPLDPKYCDHALHNDWEGCRDCHVCPDVVLIYQKTADGLVLHLLRIGNHAEVFG